MQQRLITKKKRDWERCKGDRSEGPNNSKNEYRYYHKNDEEFIVHVETLWMAMHQKTQVLHTHMINKAKARGIVF